MKGSGGTQSSAEARPSNEPTDPSSTRGGTIPGAEFALIVPPGLNVAAYAPTSRFPLVTPV